MLSGLSVILFYRATIATTFETVPDKINFEFVTFSILFPLGVDKLVKVIISLSTTIKE